jgi:hypothetical protein
MSFGPDSLQTLDNQEVKPEGLVQLDLGTTDQHQIAPYLVQELHTVYVGDEGLLQVPLGVPFAAGSAQIPSKVVRTHAPVMRKIVTYNYVRLGLIPAIPPPETDDPNLRLLEHRRNPVASFQVGNSLFAYAVTGEYEYAVLTPLTSQDAMPFGKNAAFKTEAVDARLTPANYDPSILPS